MYAFINNVPLNLLKMKVKGPKHITLDMIGSALKIFLGDKEFYKEQIKKYGISKEALAVYKSLINSDLISYREIEKDVSLLETDSYVVPVTAKKKKSEKDGFDDIKYYRIEPFSDDELFYYIFEDDVNIVVSEIYKSKEEAAEAIKPVIEKINKIAARTPKFKV